MDSFQHSGMARENIMGSSVDSKQQMSRSYPGAIIMKKLLSMMARTPGLSPLTLEPCHCHCQEKLGGAAATHLPSLTRGLWVSRYLTPSNAEESKCLMFSALSVGGELCLLRWKIAHCRSSLDPGYLRENQLSTH